MTMHLSERPAPTVPATHDALMEGLRTTYAALDAELDAALKGVTEQEAEYRVGPDDWNAKEILAHLITVEQGTQSQIYAAIEDTDVNAPFFSNEPRRIRAVASTYGTLATLTKQLKLAEAVTIAQAATMPTETQAHKHLYTPVAIWLSTFQDHYRTHIAEMVKSIKAARSQA